MATDPTDETALFADLDATFLPALRNLDTPHPRLMVMFSGPPSSGKSTIARTLETALQGLRLENDAVRTLLVDKFPGMNPDERSALTYAYASHVRDNLISRAANGLWIIDASVDRSYDVNMMFANKHGFATFLIAMDIPEETHRDWILRGGDRPFNTAAVYLQYAAQRRQEQALLLQHVTPNIILRPGYDMTAVVDAVRAKLTTLLA